jgi:thymidylate synthase ThyX
MDTTTDSSLIELFARLTPSSETLTPDEAKLIKPFFTNPDRSVVAFRNLPEVIKGALFSRYSRSAKGVRRLFLDEFLIRPELGIDESARAADALAGRVRASEEKAEAFYARILSDYGDDSVGELGGAHVACQDISQLAAKALEDNRIGLSYLEKSSRYVPFDDKVNGNFRYYRSPRILESRFAESFTTTIDGLFDRYARALPRMIEHLVRKYPIETLEFENAITGDIVRYPQIRDESMFKSAQFAYRSSVKARACDVLRCFLPLATLTNVGVWGNGRALEYLLIKLSADPLEENQSLSLAMHHELSQVIGPFLKRAIDAKGQAWQRFLRDTRTAQRDLAEALVKPGLTRAPGATDSKATLVRFDSDAIERIVAAILYPATDSAKREVDRRVSELSAEEKAQVIRTYAGERLNRRHKPGRAFERTSYEFDLLMNIGEYRDLQRHRVLSPDRQMFTTALGYELNTNIEELPEVRTEFEAGMESADKLYQEIAREMPHEAQYVVPFGFRMRYNIQLNLREAIHLIELRSSPQGHPDYRRTAQEMFRAIQKAHPLLAETMKFVDLTPDIPFGRLRAEMRKARKLEGQR